MERQAMSDLVLKLTQILHTFRDLCLHLINNCKCNQKSHLFHDLIQLEKQYNDRKKTCLHHSDTTTDGVHNNELLAVLESHRSTSLAVINTCRCHQSTDIYHKLIRCERDYHLAKQTTRELSSSDTQSVTTLMVTEDLMKAMDDSVSCGADIKREFETKCDTKPIELADIKTKNETKTDIKDLKIVKRPIDDIKCDKIDVKKSFKLDVKQSVDCVPQTESKKLIATQGVGSSDKLMSDNINELKGCPKDQTLDTNSTNKTFVSNTIPKPSTDKLLVFYELVQQNSTNHINSYKSDALPPKVAQTNGNYSDTCVTAVAIPVPVMPNPKIQMTKCNECHKEFKLKSQYLSHVNKVHKKRFHCTECDYRTNKSSYLKKHLDKHLVQPSDDKSSVVSSHKSSTKPLQSQTSSLKPSEDPYLTDRPFVCHTKGCNKSFTTKQALQNHKNYGNYMTLRHLTCDWDDCHKSFFDKKSLIAHKSTHSTGSMTCSECRKQFLSRKRLLKHMQNVHILLEFKCDSCDYKTHVKYELNRHQRLSHSVAATHVSQQKHKCLINGCHKVFVTQSGLITHKRDSHWRTDSEQQYACDWSHCSRRFLTIESLEKHKRLHSFGKISTNRMRPSADDRDPPNCHVPEDTESSDDELEVVFESLANK
ncbi:unnamed protein product [Oppiella nova]|uniref:C2H2-type domain-containing protein n=1 Tax=Oppiella nova TaxID=334625 RepID=A0A7R9LB48_9ACAR|nr:unnamed protein product [Oppiella nova]CAG2161770.1 unnamed protein product [Oppiella nova]